MIFQLQCAVHGMIRESNGQQRKSKRKDIHGGSWQQKQKANTSLEHIKAKLLCYCTYIAICHVKHNFLSIVKFMYPKKVSFNTHCDTKLHHIHLSSSCNF